MLQAARAPQIDQMFLPMLWKETQPLNPAHRWFVRADNLKVIVGEELHEDGRWWLHVSASAKGRIPTWEELKLVKDFFIGEEKLAIQILPGQAEHVNINPDVLHLYHCLDERCPLPDFRTWVDGEAHL